MGPSSTKEKLRKRNASGAESRVYACSTFRGRGFTLEVEERRRQGCSRVILYYFKCREVNYDKRYKWVEEYKDCKSEDYTTKEMNLKKHKRCQCEVSGLVMSISVNVHGQSRSHSSSSSRRFPLRFKLKYNLFGRYFEDLMNAS